MIVPMNLGNQHWVCAAINFRRKRIEYYDSLGGHNPSVFGVSCRPRHVRSFSTR